MAKVRKPADRARDLKLLIKEMGRLRSLRDPMAELSGELSPPQIHVLMWLNEDGPMPLHAVAERVRCSAPTITGVIDRLERLSMVIRERDTSDRRVVIVKLTQAGAKAAKRIDAVFSQRLEELFGAMTAADGETLLEILGRVLDRFRGKKEAKSA